MASAIARELRTMLKEVYKSAVREAKKNGEIAYLAGARTVQEKLGETGDLNTVTLLDGTKRAAIDHSFRSEKTVLDKETNLPYTTVSWTNVVVNSEERDGRCMLKVVFGDETHDLAKVAA